MKEKRSLKILFTFLEVLFIVGALVALIGIVIFAINPEEQLADTRNTQRVSDVNTIINAVYRYAIEHNGSLPLNITTMQTEICATGGDCTDLVDLSVLTDNGTYIVGIPADPTGATTDGVGYEIIKDANGRITVTAPDAENSVSIGVTR